MEHTQRSGMQNKISKPQQHVQPKIILPPSINAPRFGINHSENCYERPMMLNAWTQTTADDFEKLIRIDDQWPHHTQVEKTLMEKIRVLEESFREHSEILTQMHDSNSRKPEPHQASFEKSKQRTRIEQESGQNAINGTTVSSYTESINYRIVADGIISANSEPIEIQLSETDTNMTLNSSVDSGRLEICISEDSTNIKEEQKQNESSDDMETASSKTVKRRKKNTEEDLHPSYYFHEKSAVENDNSIPVQAAPDKIEPSRLLNTNTDGIRAQQEHAVPTTQTPKVDMDSVMVSLGPNNTTIPARIYETMNWGTASIATRKLLMAVFDRETLATHSMTGKPSPAFKDQSKPLKRMLNPKVIQDIIFAVTRKCNVSEKEVRNAITTKCADENKMMKLQMKKTRLLRERNKENQANETI